METMAVNSGQAQLAVTSWGQHGTPLVALHPGVGDSRIWQWCAARWVDAGHRVIAYDRRGFGGTTAPAEDHDELADLLAVLDATTTGPVAVVGNSNGGGLALDLALAHSQRVSSLVLIAPSPSGYPYDQWETSAAEAAQDGEIAAAAEAGDTDLVNRLEVRYWLDGTEQPEGRVDGDARELMLAMNGAALQADPVGTPAERPSAWERLHEVSVPTLIIGGAHDLPGMTTICEQLAAGIAGAQLAMMADAAHCPSLDQPDELARLVLDFLSQGA